MLMRKIMISNARGLHAQTCDRIVKIAGRCRCKVSLVVKGRRASARNAAATWLLCTQANAERRVPRRSVLSGFMGVN